MLGAKAGSDPAPINLSFSGIKSFNNPSSVRVLYADVVKDDAYTKVTQVANSLIRSFLDQGIIKKN